MPERTDLTDACWASARGAVKVGDVCVAPVPALASSPAIYVPPDVPDDCVVPASLCYALIVAIFDRYAVYVPVTTADVVRDQARFDALVEQGRRAPDVLRVPALPGAWVGSAVALMAIPTTLPSALLRHKRVAAMTRSARALVARRFDQTFARSRAPR